MQSQLHSTSMAASSSVLVASLKLLELQKAVFVTFSSTRLVQGRQPGAMLLVHNSGPALTWVIFHELLIRIRGRYVSLESQCGSRVAHETGELILFHWQPVKDAENTNMSDTVDLTQACDPINLAGV